MHVYKGQKNKATLRRNENKNPIHDNLGFILLESRILSRHRQVAHKSLRLFRRTTASVVTGWTEDTPLCLTLIGTLLIIGCRRKYLDSDEVSLDPAFLLFVYYFLLPHSSVFPL